MGINGDGGDIILLAKLKPDIKHFLLVSDWELSYSESAFHVSVISNLIH